MPRASLCFFWSRWSSRMSGPPLSIAQSMISTATQLRKHMPRSAVAGAFAQTVLIELYPRPALLITRTRSVGGPTLPFSLWVIKFNVAACLRSLRMCTSGHRHLLLHHQRWGLQSHRKLGCNAGWWSSPDWFCGSDWVRRLQFVDLFKDWLGKYRPYTDHWPRFAQQCFCF
jgi:hypothetical protein